MSNALKYTPEGGRITTALSYDGKQYVLSVSDTGKGIEEEALPHLFDRFFQARGAVGGTGIGLSLVKAYVDPTVLTWDPRLQKSAARIDGANL